MFHPLFHHVSGKITTSCIHWIPPITEKKKRAEHPWLKARHAAFAHQPSNGPRRWEDAGKIARLYVVQNGNVVRFFASSDFGRIMNLGARSSGIS